MNNISQEPICSSYELAPRLNPEIWSAVSQASNLQRPDPNQDSRTKSPETLQRLQPCVAYMRQHLDQPLRISTLCAMTGLSQSHFFALFKRMTGDSPISFFIRERMRYAADVLTNSAISVKAVAASLGYHDPYYFSRLFKSVYQVAPSIYRASLVQTAPKASNANPLGVNRPPIGASGSSRPRTFSETATLSVTTTKPMHV